MAPTQQLIEKSEFQDALQALQALTLQHDRAFRLGVGSYILQRFFGGQAAAYSDRDPHKDAKFSDFVKAHSAELAELELSEHTLRRCVRAHICYAQLAPGIRDQLGWSALLVLSALADPNQRARIATAAVTGDWPVAKVKEAARLAGQHRLWDADPQEAGLQLPEPKDPALPQPGRLVTQTEKWSEQIGLWRQEFERVDAGKLSQGHRERLRLAVAAVRSQLDELEGRLGGGE